MNCAQSRFGSMKNYIFLLLLLPFLAGCRKTDVGFDMTYRRTFRINVGLDPFFSANYLFSDIPVDTAVFFQANGNITSDKIGQIVPRNMTIRPIFSGDGDLSIVRRVDVAIFDTKMNSETAVFYNNDVRLSNGQINLIPDNSDVRKLFLSGNGRYNLRIKIYFYDITPRSYDVEWSATFLAKTE